MPLLSHLTVATRPLVSLSRAYGSAAAVQLDYDYYYCDNEKEQRGNGKRRAMEELEEGWDRVARGVQWVIIGDPVARRHVYAERLSKLLDVPHISMGTLVRQEMHPHSSLYKQISSAVNQGKLVPEEDVIFGLLSKRLEEGHCRGETGFILDGVPRTRIQAEILDRITDIDLVLNLKCTEDLVMKNQGNGIYSPSQDFHCMAGSRFNLSLQPSADKVSAWKEKLLAYAEQRMPVEEYYKKQKKLLEFQVAGAPGDTWKGLLAALHLRHMNALCSSLNSSQKFAA
ncbi:probable adenylate kinase 7, mitochondrial [Olea europaea var. sylvestris]|uniref:probable adenylate kinase 7, mitochondrial n=1 Tax=Olea europaea var. sylvestris TaxID=158386 RepID=UPI000C1D1B06|nr:probable adenylate kinase 7, mitochondrial [Olea europaea var. sylvestris]